MPTPTNAIEGTALTALDLVLREVKQAQGTSSTWHVIFTIRFHVEIRDIQTAINAIIKMAQRRITSCRHRHNRLTSFLLRLPDEIISEILIHFLHVARSQGGSTYYERLGNLRLVCKTFHAIADGTPRLWNLIDGGGIHDIDRDLRRTVCLLEKSRNAPLDIDISIIIRGRDNTLPMLHLLAPHSHRWRSFRCQYLPSVAGDDAVRSSIDNLASLQAPRLLKFALECGGLYRPQVDLFGSAHTSLQSLDTGSLVISWDSAILSGLRFLRITAWDGVREPTGEQYLRMLSSCPRLMELHLKGRDKVFRMEELGARFHSPIALPELKTVSLGYLHPVTIRSLLSSIQADLINLKIIFSNGLEDQWKEVIDSTLLGSGSRHIITPFTSSPNSIYFMGHNDFTGTNPFHLSTDRGNNQVSKHLICGFDESPLSVSLYRKLVEPSAYTVISSLTLDVGTEYLDEDFGYREILQRLVGLRELHMFHDMELLAILELLSEKVSSDSSGNTWLCPNLEELHTMWISFDITELLDFAHARYRCDGEPPTRLKLIVDHNANYKDLEDVPIDVAHTIADILGFQNFVWEGWTLIGVLNPEWV
ncbi:hypothetical protein FRC03_011965 [Tulasnella sp. 419]|nr:hypothetical protein FRC03_011965 [Tulasnella sp. 419]